MTQFKEEFITISSIDNLDLKIRLGLWQQQQSESYVENNNNNNKLNNNNNTTVVCLHGTFQSIHSFDEFAQIMSEEHGYRVVAFDHRGHGESSWAKNVEGYRLETYTADAKKIIDYCINNNIIQGRFVLLGLSLGGMIVMKLATDESLIKRKLSKAIVVDIAPTVQDEGVGNIRKFVSQYSEMDSFEEFVETVHKLNPQRSKENIRSRLNNNLYQKENGKWTWKYDLRLKETMIKSHERNTLQECVRKANIPALIIRGENSSVVSKEDIKSLCNNWKDQCYSVEIPKAGHSVIGDNTEDVVKSVLEFLN